jgi:hypothetical protein
MLDAPTIDEMLALDAGPELDAVIAERVFGWVRWKGTDGVVELHEPRAERWLPRYGFVRTDEAYARCDTSTHRFSTDIAAAWTLIDYWRDPNNTGGPGEMSIHCESDQDDDDGGQWVCGFGVYAEGVAVTPPLAICRAILLALAHKTNQVKE